MTRFDRTYLIACLDARGDRRPFSAEHIWSQYSDGERSEREIVRDLERLVFEGVLIRTEHDTYCSECGSDSGVEFRYQLRSATEPAPDIAPEHLADGGGSS